MSKLKVAQAAAACLLAFVMLNPVHALPQTIKITVISQDAVVYAKPDTASQVIQNPPNGVVLEAEELIGEWYRVKVRSRVGMTITGYIHKQWVKPEGDAPAQPPRIPEKPRADTSRTGSDTRPGRTSPPRGELALRFGMSSGSLLNDFSAYSESWSSGLLASVSETGGIHHAIKNPLGIGIGFAYGISGGLGIQVKVDYNFTSKMTDDGFSNYSMTWSWTDGDGPYDTSEEWPVTGELSVIPVSLNLLYKIQGGGLLVPYISGGATYFLGSVKASSKRGAGITWDEEGLQYIDYLDVPVQIDESISHLGFNVGGGLDLMFSANVGLNLDACYYLGKKTPLTWQHAGGTLPGNLFPNSSWALDQENIDALNQQISPLEVNTSFIKLQAGIKFLF